MNLVIQGDRPFHTRADVLSMLLGNVLCHDRKDNEARENKQTNKRVDFYHFTTKENAEQKTPKKRQFRETICLSQTYQQQE